MSLPIEHVHISEELCHQAKELQEVRGLHSIREDIEINGIFTKISETSESGDKVSAVIGVVSGDSQGGEDQTCVNSGGEESIQCQ